MVNSPSVIIVGAGAAGIAAACRLYQRGIKNLTILEAKNRIGGRINTVDFADNVVELGAQWVHGEEGNVVHKLAQPLGLLESSYNFNDFDKQTFINSQGAVMPQAESAEVWKLYYKITEEAEQDLKNATGSYGDYFIKKFYCYLEDTKFTNEVKAKEYLEWLQKFDNSLQCSDTWFEVSARGLSDYWQCEGDHVLNWKDRGYKTLFDLLMCQYPDASKRIPITDKIKFSTEVSSIDYSKPKVSVTTTQGDKFTADSVIFTASLGVLKAQHSTLFNPQLPNKKILSIEGLNIGSVNKFFLEFPHRWWPENLGCFNFIWTQDDKKQFLENQPRCLHWLLDVFSFFTVDYQPRVLCGWIAGENSKFVETLSDAEVKAGLCEILERFLGKNYNIPGPDNFLRSKWYTDKHFRGCYSYQSIKTDQLGASARNLAEPIISGTNEKPVLLFAGEATHDHYYSTVHGAVETGVREADRLVDYYNRQVLIRSNSQAVERTRIVIIGAGIAGLSAAKTLEDHQFYDYILLEAQDYIGGRIKSIAWNDNWIEEGAQFLHGDKSEFANLCHKNGLISEEESGEGEGIFVRSDGLHINKDSIKKIDDLVRDTLENCEKYVHETEDKAPLNIKSALRTAMKDQDNNLDEHAETIYNWNVRFLLIDNSCDNLEDLSAKNWGKFQFVGGPEHLIFNNGYKSSLQLIYNNLKGSLRMNSPVRRIEWHKNVPEGSKPVTLILDDKKIISDCVLVTTSLGYLKANPKMFSPRLADDLHVGIECLGFGLMNKIMLDFGEAWWEPGVKGIQLLWPENDEDDTMSSVKLASWTRDLTGFDVLQNQEAVLLGWVGGKGARIIEDLSDETVGFDCIDVLRFFLKRDNLPAPKRCKRSQWGSNEFIKGSYSHISTKCDNNFVSPKTLSRPIWATVRENNKSKNIPVIMLAGEATSEHFYSTTHGAFETGKNQAHTFLLHHVKNN